MSTKDPSLFSSLLLRYRAASHMTQEQLAARSGLSVDAIAALERGKRRFPRAATVHLIADGLGLTDAERTQLQTAARLPAKTSAGNAATAAHHLAPSRHMLSMAQVARVQMIPLVDRKAEIDTVRQRLTEENVRLLTLTGPAGVGKTRLALAAAQRIGDEFADGVVVVDLTAVRDPQQVLGAIARTFGFTDTGYLPLGERIQEYLRARSALLVVLDNFEQVLPAASQLANLLAICPGLYFIITSRVPLRLRWEQTLRVPLLPVPNVAEAPLTLDAIEAFPSVEFFMGRAQAHRPDFTLTEARAPLVAQLVVQLDGLPLAMNLAAARLDTLPLATIVSRVEDHLRLLHWEASDVPERQQSLTAALGWSYELLDAGEQRLFRHLGVFVGQVTADAITAVADAPVAKAGGKSSTPDRGVEHAAMLMSLAEKSLTLPGWLHETDDARPVDEDPDIAFDMLETVREFAWEQLAEQGELEAARRAHAYYFLGLAEEAAPQLHRHGQKVWYLRLDREHDNLRAALRWLLDQEDVAEREAGLRLAAALGFFWWRRGYHAEGRRWLAEALERAPATDPDVRLRALVAAGPGFALQGHVESARAALQEALALAVQRRNASATGEALAYLGLRAVLAGELMEATSLLWEALRHWETLGDPYGLGLTNYFLGHLAVATGDVADAGAYYRDALRWLEASGDAHLAGFVHCYLGATEGTRGKRLEAVEEVQAGLLAGVHLQDRWLLGVGAHAAALFGAWSDPATGARLLGVADAMAQATGATLVWSQLPGRWEVAGLRERLAREGEGELAAEYRAGRVLRFGDASALALTVLENVARTLAQVEPESRAAPEARHESKSLLSAREQEVLRLVAEGLSSKAIGRRLFRSTSTVNQHIKSILNKLGADTRAQAVAVATQRGEL